MTLFWRSTLTTFQNASLFRSDLVNVEATVLGNSDSSGYGALRRDALYIEVSFLLSFLKIITHVRKIAKGDYLLCHVCPSVRMQQLGPHLLYFHEI